MASSLTAAPASRLLQGLRLWLPPLLLAAAILSAAGERLSAAHTLGLLGNLLEALGLHLSFGTVRAINVILRKTTHLLEYALLYLLWWRAVVASRPRRERAGCLLALGLVLLVACTDELLQSRTRARGASPFDVMLDFSGGLAAAAAWRAVRLRQARTDPPLP